MSDLAGKTNESAVDAVDRFLWAARSLPDRLAIEIGSTVWCYAELEAHVRAYAAMFARKPAARVAIALPQSHDAYAAMLAAGLSGGYHSPLNTQAPTDKLARIIARLRPDFIVADASLGASLASFAPGSILIEPRYVSGGQQFQGPGSRHHVAYVMFTSGSTGEPKGVVVSRPALNNYIGWLATLGLTEADRLSQQPNLAFDISMTDIYGAFCFGASLHPLVDEVDRMMPARFIARQGITIWNSTPSAVSLMTRARQLTTENVKTVRLFNFCGEPLYPEQVSAIFAASEHALVQNTYGPTEATIAVTEAKLTANNYRSFARSTIAIGDPLPNMRLELLGGPDGDEGEIVIFGPQLADGYWEDEDRTNAVFAEFGGERGYRTGDWAVRIDGNVYFKERIDFQVKVRGFRIELDEVASALRKCGWTVATVFKRGEGLCAVVERVEGLKFDEVDLKARMARFIEGHAIPERIVSVDHIPRSANDKLDRKAAAQLFEMHLQERKRGAA